MLPHAIFQSAQYAALSPRAVKLLIDLLCQYRGTNNGDLCASWAVMRKSGWRSKSQLRKALLELDAARWVSLTRQGDINKPSLYAVTFQGVDYCGGKLDVTADPKASHAWKFPDTVNAQKLSGRRVRARTADLHTGEAPPHGGAIVHRLQDRLPRTEGRCVA